MSAKSVPGVASGSESQSLGGATDSHRPIHIKNTFIELRCDGEVEEENVDRKRLLRSDPTPLKGLAKQIDDAMASQAGADGGSVDVSPLTTPDASRPAIDLPRPAPTGQQMQHPPISPANSNAQPPQSSQSSLSEAVRAPTGSGGSPTGVLVGGLSPAVAGGSLSPSQLQQPQTQAAPQQLLPPRQPPPQQISPSSLQQPASLSLHEQVPSPAGLQQPPSPSLHQQLLVTAQTKQPVTTLHQQLLLQEAQKHAPDAAAASKHEADIRQELFDGSGTFESCHSVTAGGTTFAEKWAVISEQMKGGRRGGANDDASSSDSQSSPNVGADKPRKPTRRGGRRARHRKLAALARAQEAAAVAGGGESAAVAGQAPPPAMSGVAADHGNPEVIVLGTGVSTLRQAPLHPESAVASADEVARAMAARMGQAQALGQHCPQSSAVHLATSMQHVQMPPGTQVLQQQPQQHHAHLQPQHLVPPQVQHPQVPNAASMQLQPQHGALHHMQQRPPGAAEMYRADAPLSPAVAAPYDAWGQGCGGSTANLSNSELIGKRVLITGLLRTPHFNGQWGRVESYDAQMDRFLVSVPSSQGSEPLFAKLRRENLVVPATVKLTFDGLGGDRSVDAAMPQHPAAAGLPGTVQSCPQSAAVWQTAPGPELAMSVAPPQPVSPLPCLGTAPKPQMPLAAPSQCFAPQPPSTGSGSLRPPSAPVPSALDFEDSYGGCMMGITPKPSPKHVAEGGPGLLPRKPGDAAAALLAPPFSGPSADFEDSWGGALFAGALAQGSPTAGNVATYTTVQRTLGQQ